MPLQGEFFQNPGGSGAFYEHEINQSVRFEEDAGDKLTRTPSSSGNRRTWTWSCWIKRTVISHSGNHMVIWGADSGASSSYFDVRFTNTDVFTIAGNGGTEINYSPKYRDTTGWGHYLIAYDTTQATSSNRIKFFFNGTQVTDTTYNALPSQDFQSTVNSTTEHQIGELKYASATTDFAAYIAEFIIIDGTALGPDSFTETKNGVLIPKDVSGLTFGTNGVYLKFENASDLGNDSSGNNNDWSATNMSADRQVLVSPTFSGSN